MLEQTAPPVRITPIMSRDSEGPQSFRKLSRTPPRVGQGLHCDASALAQRRRTLVGSQAHHRMRGVTPLKEALTALADALAKRPAEEILFEWFRSGRLVGELSALMKRRHPEVQAEIDRVYLEHLAKLGKKRR